LFNDINIFRIADLNRFDLFLFNLNTISIFDGEEGKVEAMDSGLGLGNLLSF